MWYWWIAGYLAVCMVMVGPMYLFCKDRRHVEYWSDEEFYFNLGFNVVLWPGWIVMLVVVVGFTFLVKYPLIGVGKLCSRLFGEGL